MDLLRQIHNTVRLVARCVTDPEPLQVSQVLYTGSPSDITIKWDDSDSQEKQLERIITQKWIANFPLGLEA